MQFRVVSVAVLTGLLVSACTTGEEADPVATPPAGPLAATVGGGAELPETDLFGYVLGVADDATVGVVWADTSADLTSESTRIGVGTDPDDWTVASPAGVFSYQDVATPALADDGSLDALAVLRSEEANNVLAVLRVAPDGTVTTTPVPDTSFSRFECSDVDAVSDDGRTAVVVEQLFDGERPDDPRRLEVTTVDLPTATLVARTVVDVPVAARDVEVGPDGAVTVLAAGYEGGGPTRLLRFDGDLERQDDVPLESADTASRASQLALTPDGTAVVSLVVGDPTTGEGLATLVRTVAPGSAEVRTVAELADRIGVEPQRAGNSLLTAINGWAYLFLRDPGAGGTALTPVDLGTGVLGEPVPTCDSVVPEQVARSGSGSSVAAVFSCIDEPGDRLLTLAAR